MKYLIIYLTLAFPAGLLAAALCLAAGRADRRIEEQHRRELWRIN